MAPLNERGPPIVICGTRCEDLIRRQLVEIGFNAFLLLEPELRDTGPTMAAAAVLTASLERDGEPGDSRLEQAAVESAAALWRYLETPVPGLWRDKQAADGAFVDEPSPASSLYHILGAVMALQAWSVR